MARYTGPKTKISRRFGEPVFGPDKYLDRRNFAPGQHGPANKTRRRKLSDYGMQLREKQKAKYVYGMLEKQFRRFYEIARARTGNTADILLQLCESRLDNVVYRLGLAPTRPAARQLVTHRHIELVFPEHAPHISGQTLVQSRRVEQLRHGKSAPSALLRPGRSAPGRRGFIHCDGLQGPDTGRDQLLAVKFNRISCFMLDFIPELLEVR